MTATERKADCVFAKKRCERLRWKQIDRANERSEGGVQRLGSESWMVS